MKNLKNDLFKGKSGVLGGLLLIALFVLPLISFAGSRKDIYVSANAAGREDGSAAHPYKTISEALVHANSRTDVHVLKGSYKDNIEIPKGVRVFGSDRDDVVIRSRSSKKVVVSMKNDTVIDGVTIEQGKGGIWIKGDAEVSVVDCVIRDNESDGIKIEEGSAKHDKVSITNSRIEDNGKSGIYSGKRKIVLINNEIINNDKDGVDLAAGTSAWLEKNEIKKNDKSGIKLTLDRSGIWMKNNSIRDNEREGIEINAYGGAGRIDINKAKIEGNGNYGVAKISRAGFSRSIWNGFTIHDTKIIDGNKKGSVSAIIAIF